MSDKQLWPDAYIPREDAEAVVAEWKQRAEAAAWQDGGFCSQCGADRVRTSTDDIDAPMLHTLSYCVACGGFWIWDHEAQQSERRLRL